MADPVRGKRLIRRQALAWRNSIPLEEHSRMSDSICRNIAALEEYRSAAGILFYMPIRSEVDVLPLLGDALRQGKRCALPKCADGSTLQAYYVQDLSVDLEAGTWGIPEPKVKSDMECSIGELSVIIMPGVAYDRVGWRLGYGSGYYDRYLAQPNDALKIAPAFSGQIVTGLPAGEWDIPMDFIVTEREIIRCTTNGRNRHG